MSQTKTKNTTPSASPNREELSSDIGKYKQVSATPLHLLINYLEEWDFLCLASQDFLFKWLVCNILTE